MSNRIWKSCQDLLSKRFNRTDISRMNNRRLIKITAHNWENYFADATRRALRCEPELLIDHTPAINLYLFDYGRTSKYIHYFVGCELRPAEVETRANSMVSNVRHVHINHALPTDTRAIDENLFEFDNHFDLDEVHLFYAPSDIYSFYISEEAIKGMRLSEDSMDDMECRGI
ncbi:hypothetical protein [Saccharicrinis aurantiacus]|uniref:hypothetical protein n=1 Tax=Saccharicrinis aurantiacus TaxID=1849719 RepID=UPI0011152E6A|nr:hypothetical protein [Saccharicrinis aurantiacus]